MENAIRNLRRQILADEETKSPDLQKHQIRLRVLQSEYTKFCKAANLPTRNERLQVAGFGRSQASKAVWTYRRSKVSDDRSRGIRCTASRRSGSTQSPPRLSVD